MPAWWKGKSKSKSTSSPRKKEVEEVAAAVAEEDETPRRGRETKKEGKANSFDEVLGSRRSRDPSPIYGGRGSAAFQPDFAVGLPLPLPSSISSPLPEGSASASASASSVSSSGSSDETPDLGFRRYSDPINTPRGRNGLPDVQRNQHVTEDRHVFACSPVAEHPRGFESSASPLREFPVLSFDNSSNGGALHSRGQNSVETIFGRRTEGSSPRGRGSPFSTSPVHPRSLGLSPASPKLRQDNIRSPIHPLPLPPNSPSSSSSSSSHSPKSQWKKGKLLGRGTFGHVYLGFNSESGLMCAIKEVKYISGDGNSKECLGQLKQEITLLSQLSHPNIVQYYGSELVDDTLSVFLEYVSGGSIYKLLQEYGPFKEALVRSYTAQILSGLAYLHGRNTVHRDIKGANILVGPNGEIKVADFGMAKHISSYTSIRSFKGSPYWMAPEVIMNSNGYNLSVDIWSLGCTIIEMANGKPPWSQYEGVPAIFKIGNSKEVPELPEHFSHDGKDFLKQCLQRDPSLRPTALQLMDHPFVRDQITKRPSMLNTTHETLPAFSDGSHVIMTSTESPSNRSTSPLHDMDYVNRSVSPLHDRDYVNRNTSPFHDREYVNRSTSPLHDRDYVRRSTSPLHDRDYVRRSPGFPLALPSTYKSKSDLSNMKTNMSLPVSPCSSPLRQFKQSNRSCLPSPPHPAYSAGAANYSPINYALYPTRPSNELSDPWHDFGQTKSHSPYGSPRRLSMGM